MFNRMLLAVDIGNTNITFGIFNNKRIIKIFDIPTKDYCLMKLKNNLRGVGIKGVIVSSVVPSMNKILEKDIKYIFDVKPYILGEDARVPIKNLYRFPRQVGQDRLVNAYAAFRLYGGPLIVVDFGTAITFDVVSKRGEYLGGMILPGLGISLDALYQKTALLPKVKLKKPREFIGKDTENSILSGLIYGFSELTDGMASRIKKEIGREAKVIGTGGNIELISGYCRQFDLIEKNLTLKGLNFIYQLNDKKLRKNS